MSNNLVRRYLPAALLANLIPAMEGPLCSVGGLRAINIPILLALPFLYSSLLAKIRTPTTPQKGDKIHKKTEHFFEAVSISFFPLVFFFGGLFYTDVGGLVLILASYRAALSDRWMLSALVCHFHPRSTRCEVTIDDSTNRSARFPCCSVKPISSGSDSSLRRL